MNDFIEFGALNVVVTVPFRDGERDVPDYFAQMISSSGIDFHAVTFEEATKLVSELHMRSHLNGIAANVIAGHRKTYG